MTTQDHAHLLSPHRLDVKGINVDRTGWVDRHYDALTRPTMREKTIIDYAELISTYKVWYGDDGYSVPEVIAPMLHGFTSALNLDLGRLDAGTLHHYAGEVAREVGWNLDADTWAEESKQPMTPCELCAETPGHHADLHVGHIWTNRDCLAYSTRDGEDCTCQRSAEESNR